MPEQRNRNVAPDVDDPRQKVGVFDPRLFKHIIHDKTILYIVSLDGHQQMCLGGRNSGRCFGRSTTDERNCDAQIYYASSTICCPVYRTVLMCGSN
jgi:hypothetical protein